MSSQYEEWFFVKDGKVYYHYENDGYQALRKGLQGRNTLIATVQEVKGILKNASEITKEIERYEQELP